MNNKNDYRRGNLVEFSGDIIEIDAMNSTGIYTKEFGYLFFDEFNNTLLTVQLIEQIGFYKNGTTKHPNQLWRLDCEEGYFDLEQIGDGFYLEDNKNFGTKIEFLHKLQNIIYELLGDEIMLNQIN